MIFLINDPYYSTTSSQKKDAKKFIDNKLKSRKLKKLTKINNK
jgi:hypothetical protein